MPLVTIGVPLFNEATYVEDALASLLEQDYPNFEIVVVDNGSTDRTEAICRDLADKDKRVQYHRLPENLGAASSSNRTIALAAGTYFMRASGHDRWSPNYVSSCVAAIALRPDAVIAFGSTEWIDEANRPYPKETGWSDMRGMSAVERFFTQLWGNMHPIMGVARTDTIRRAMPFANMAAADLALLLELSLMGEFVHAPAATWYRRETRGPQSYRQRMRRYKSDDFGLIRSRLDALIPYARLVTRIPRIILRSRISMVEKAVLLGLLYPTMIGRYVGAIMRHAATYEREKAPSE